MRYLQTAACVAFDFAVAAAGLALVYGLCALLWVAEKARPGTIKRMME